MARICIDVGAHVIAGPGSCDVVYAFEPNVPVAVRSWGRHSRVVVIPMAVSEFDGLVVLHLMASDKCASLLPLDAEGCAAWKHNAGLEPGDRLADIDRICMEVQIVRSPYAGAATKQQAIDYLAAHGFELVAATPQSHGQEENLDFMRIG